ncbi:hypothetical protein ILUMI_09301 [Ignelater luminosus]|uniref:Cytochrome c oxidase subunit 5A, mitochondrial n=1 Tax=Ignelater luminosus TaxID=2038154 RepID=A0A8K0D006_IGNLU|nr:hypothetical protein ILUMI_09301 [Ignelater luminosus]
MSLVRTAAGKVFEQMARLVRPARRNIYHYQLLHEPIDDLIHRYECFFCRQDIDGWDIRQAMNDLAGMDMVSDPRIIIAALYACRRVNEYALAVRYLESVKYKCGPNVDRIYPYLLQEIAPTLNELGIDTPEALGYDKPELFLVDVDMIH